MMVSRFSDNLYYAFVHELKRTLTCSVDSGLKWLLFGPTAPYNTDRVGPARARGAIPSLNVAYPGTDGPSLGLRGLFQVIEASVQARKAPLQT